MLSLDVKVQHSRSWILLNPLVHENLFQSKQDNLRVEAQGHVLDIVYIQRQPVSPSRVVSPTDLSQTSNPWSGGEPNLFFLGVITVVPHQQRPGTNQTHLPFEYIKQLRQFIKAGPPQQATPVSYTHLTLPTIYSV